MSVDRQGNPVQIGTAYVLAGVPRHDESADSVVLVLGNGTKVRCRAEDLLPLSEVDALGAAALAEIGTAAGQGAAGNHGIDSHPDVDLSGAAPFDALMIQPITGYVMAYTLGAAAFSAVGTTLGTVAAGDDARFLATRFHPWARPIVKAEWMSTQFAGWGGAFAGGGTSYIAQPQFFGANFDTRIVTAATVDTAGGTSGTIGACRFHNDNGRVGLSDGYVIAFNTQCVNVSEIQACRIGFAGNASAPGATGRPAAGVWLEFDRSVSATDWNLTCGAGSVYTAQGTGLAVPGGTWEWWALVYESASSVKLYALDPSKATLVATVTTNAPSSTTERTGRLFFQIEKINPASSARAHLQNDLFAVIPSADRYPVLP